MADEQQLDMQILGFESGDLVAGARKIMIRTNRGEIPLILHATETPSRVVLCVCGAIGGFDGPSMLYPRLGLEMPRKDISIARANYRTPNDFGECLLDALAALTFLKGTGYERAAEPKTLKLFEGADHRLSQVGDELFTLVEDWITTKV